MNFMKMVSGGVKFDKKRFGHDIDVFKAKPVADKRAPSLDFFKQDAAEVVEEEKESSEEEDSVQVFANSEKAVVAETDSSKGNQEERALTKELRKEQHIRVSGSNVSDPLVSFEAFAKAGVPDYIVNNLRQPIPLGCGYEKPTPVQVQGVPILLQRRELVACAPTGSGKTACYLVPILSLLKAPGKAGIRAVVLSPTRELSEQIFRYLTILSTGRHWKHFLLSKANANANTFGSQSSNRKDVLVATPLRLVNLIRTVDVKLTAVELLILDEADRLFEATEEGEQGFDTQIDEILAACSHPKITRAMFSATMPQGFENLVKSFLRDPIRITVGTKGAAASSVQQELIFVGREDGKLLALRNLIQKGLKLPMLIFVQSKERAAQLYSELVYDELNVDVIHSDRSVAQRTNVIKRFRSGEVWVLICTDLMARGIDFKGVNCVLNYDFPQSNVSYIHRIGRSGRAGREGYAITFFTEADAPLLRSIANVLKASGCEIAQWMLELGLNKNVAAQIKKQAPPRESISTLPKEDRAKTRKRKRTKSKGPQKQNETKVAEVV